MLEEKLKIARLKKGTVIDHIDAGYALTIMGLTGSKGKIEKKIKQTIQL